MKAARIASSAKVERFRTKLAIDFGDSIAFESIHPVAYVTSEANIHGAMHTHGDWYDGQVDKIEIGRKEKEIRTSNVQETIHSYI